MANTVVNRILHNGVRNLITQHILSSSTNAAADNESAVVKVGSAGAVVTGLTAHLKVRRIIYNVSPNCQVAAQWNGATPQLIAALTGFGDYDLQDTQGIFNDATTPTFDISFTTVFPTANPFAGLTGGYTIVLEMIKGT